MTAAVGNSRAPGYGGRVHRLERSQLLHARARRFVDAFTARGAPPESFDALASDLARFQADFAPGYARLCAARGVDLSTVARADALPAVPTDAFKLTRVSVFGEDETPVTFRTSGTTVGDRGAHPFRDTATYDAGALAFGRWSLARDLAGTLRVLVLGPPPDEAPDSSLTHMCAMFARELGGDGSSRAFFVEGGVIDLARLDEEVSRALVSETPVLLLATSFALVHLLDGLGDADFRLPPGSRVMTTGGTKGKSREVSGDALREEIARVFHVDRRAVVSEYGMTELSSQFYETAIFDAEAPEGVHAEPPWARVTAVDPETLAPVPEGEVGLARIVDLLNVDSAVAVLTQDRVRRAPGGFELLGRSPGAPPRGCSLAIDELLGRA